MTDRAKYLREYREKNKQKLSEYQKKWYQKNKNDPEFKKRAKSYRLKHRDHINKRSALWKENNCIKHLLSNAKYRAKRIGLEFNLDVSDIIIPDKCPYLEIELTSDKLKGHLDSHMSVDRIDSSKGYVKGNVEIISYRANAMKQNATKDQLIKFAENVLRKFKNE